MANRILALSLAALLAFGASLTVQGQDTPARATPRPALARVEAPNPWLPSNQTVPIYTTYMAPQVEYILRDCAAKVIVVSNDKELSKVMEVRGRCPAAGRWPWAARCGRGASAD